MPTIAVRWSDNTKDLKKNLAEGVDQIEATKASVEKLVKAFAGDNLIAAAHKWTAAISEFGPVSKLAAADATRAFNLITKAIEALERQGKPVPAAMRSIASELEKLQPLAKGLDQVKKSGEGWSSWLGKVTPLLGALGVAMSAATVVRFGKSLLADADALTKLSDKTGVSVQWLQKFQVAGDDAGNTVEQMTSAISQMQNRMASGDPGFGKAIGDLNISISEFRDLKPEDQFVRVSDALRKIEDPARRVQIAMDLFGKSGAEILPTLGRGFDDVKDKIVGMSDETVKKLDAAGDRLASWSRQLKGIIATAIVEGVDNWRWALDAMLNARSGGALGKQSAEAAAVAKMAAVAKATKAAQVEQDKLTAAWEAGYGPVMDLAVQAAVYTDRLKKQESAQTKAEAASKTATAELIRWHEALANAEHVIELSTNSIGELDTATLTLTRAWTDQIDKLKEVERWTHVAVFGYRGLADGLENVGQKVEVVGSMYTQDVVGPMQDSVGVIKGTDSALSDLTEAFAQLAQISGGAFSGVVKSIGMLIGALNVAQTAMKALESTTVTGASRMVSVLSAAGNWFTLFLSIATAVDKKLGESGARLMANLQTQKQMLDAFMERWQELTASGASNFFSEADAAKIQKVWDILAEPVTEESTKRLAKAIQEALAVIEKSWAQILEEGTDALGFINKHLKEQIALEREAGLHAKEIAEYLKSQGHAAISAFNGIAAAVGNTRQELEDLGVIALGTFAAAIDAGLSFSEALKAAGPGLSALSKAMKDLGIDMDNAALKALLLQNTILQNNPTLIAGIDALGASFVALSNLGMLNQETFDALTRTGMSMYTRIQAEVAKVGGTTKDALLPMQDYLHRAEKAAKELGIPLDENTQMLIDQSKELGIWKEAGKTAAEKTELAMNKLTDAIDRLTLALLGIPDVDFDVTEHRKVIDETGGPPSLPPGPVKTPGPIKFATGGIVGASMGRLLGFQSSGTDTVPAMLTPGEMVLTQPQQRAVFGGGSGEIVNLTANLVLENHVVTSVVLTDILRNKRGAGTRLKKALDAA